MTTLLIRTMTHCLSYVRQGEVQEDEDAVEEFVEEAEDQEGEAEKQNAAEVGKELQVEEEGRGVEAGAEVAVILCKKLVRSSNWSIMNSSYRHVYKNELHCFK